MADDAPTPIRLIPLDAIDERALARDRTTLDADALAELRASIALSGLRMPIEVYALAEPEGPLAFGLISGFRRLEAFRALRETARDKTRYVAVPAFVREPGSIAAALASMVEENAVRAEISPWEQGRIAVTARDHGVFETVDAAIETLYPSFSRQKRARLRAVAQVTEELDGQLTAPEALSSRQVLRLATALTRGYGELMRHALGEARRADPASQWRTLLSILVEAETADAPDPLPGHAHRSDRPRRLLSPRPGVKIRREMTQGGWSLHFTGPAATGMMIDSVFDEIERLFGPA